MINQCPKNKLYTNLNKAAISHSSKEEVIKNNANKNINFKPRNTR